MPDQIGGKFEYFYPRSPRGERPSRKRSSISIWPDFYPRSPRGERLEVLQGAGIHLGISIHAPREGSDGLQRP